MKRNFVVGLCGGLIGWAMLLLLFSAAGVVGAHAISSQPVATHTQEVSAVTLLTSTFTYQGQLQSGGKPVSATCNFQFGLWDAASSGNMIGVTQTVSSLSVNNGYFTALLNSGSEFGVSAFTGNAQWLEITVQCPAIGGASVTLSPRQSITAAPYALFSTSTGALQGRAITTTAPGANQVLKWNGSVWSPADDAIGSPGSGDISGVYAGNGLTGGGASGEVTLTVNYAGSGVAFTAAHSDHNHWGQSWSGSGTGLSLSGGATGLSGSGSTYGVYGQSSSNSGTGVYGDASALDGTTYGVYGEVVSPSGTGVYGQATATSGAARGVLGMTTAPGNSGPMITFFSAGVQGDATSATGPAVGVWGTSASTSGRGVYGNAWATSGTTYGVYGSVDSPSGYAGSFTSSAGNGVTINVPSSKVGLNVASGYAWVAGNTIWHAGNDGTGSGLDADLLDGIQGSAYWNTGNDGTGSGLDADLLDGIQGSSYWNSGNDGAGSGLDADLLDGQQGSYYQPRVSGTCAVGSTIRAINADGSVVCQVDAPLDRPVQPTANVYTTLDLPGDVGDYSSITIGVDGLGLISYYDATNHDLKVAHCNDAVCSSATYVTLDASSANIGLYTSIAIGADGLGLISYWDYTHATLKVAHCSNTACSSATTYTLDSTVLVGSYTSIVIGADGLGLISYADITNSDLKVAHCSNTACSSATTITLDSAGNVGAYTSITIGADGLGLISYYDVYNGDLKVAHCSNTACSSATTTILDSTGDVGQYTSITTGADGLGLISYWDYTNFDLKVAHCSNTACSSATYTATGTGDGGAYSSITIGTDGLGLIDYYDVTNGDLKVAHCLNIVCSPAIGITLDTIANTGQYTAITIGADGLPLISYHLDTNGDLKVAHCSNALCVPYLRRR